MQIVKRAQKRIRDTLREKAIENAKKRLWVEGLQIPDLTEEEYEVIIKEEEDKIVSSLKVRGSLGVALSVLGLNIFW